MSAIITSKLSPNAADFQQNRAAMQEIVDDLYVHLRKSFKVVQSARVPSI